MRVLLFFLTMVIAACGDDNNSVITNQTLSIRLIESFKLESKLVTINEVANSKGDSFRIICKNDDSIFLDYTHSTPSNFIRAEDIAGDAYSEIIIDDCVADEFGSLLIFKFNTITRKYDVVFGTDSLSTEIYRLKGTDLFYDSFCTNQSGCHSTLFRFENDSCIRIASVFVPYNSKELQYQQRIDEPTVRLIPIDQWEDDSKVLENFWSSKH